MQSSEASKAGDTPAKAEDAERRPSGDRRRSDHSGGHRQSTPRRPQALAVVVDDRGIESALRAFKRMVLKEGLLKDLKRRQYFEKPSDRLRRKRREAVRRRRRQEARARRPWT